MMKNPSRELSKVFDLIIPPLIQMHISKWEVVIVCRSRTLRGIIPLQAIQLSQFGDLEAAVVLVYSRFGRVRSIFF